MFEKILSSSSRDFTVVEGQTLFGWQISAYLGQVCAFSCYLMPFDEHKHILQLSKENYFEKCVTFFFKFLYHSSIFLGNPWHLLKMVLKCIC